MNTVEPARGRELVAVARRAIAEALTLTVETVETDAPWLAEPVASFVTLRIDGRLRGCIGSLEPRRSLADDVRSNALAAAFHDPRFPPLGRAEWAQVRLEVSLLSPLEPLAAGSERELVAALRPGVDGLLLESAGRRATFLPQVWENLRDPRDFVHGLERKAGLEVGGWRPETRCWRYTVAGWAE